MSKLPTEEKIKYFVNVISDITNLEYFGEYLTTLIELDAIILNEDRHFHNIAILQNADKTYDYCPLFDNGAGLLSDMRNDYPLEKNTFGLIPNVKAKPFSDSFDEQIEICEKLYGRQLQFGKNINISGALKNISSVYGAKISDRIKEIYTHQRFLYLEYFSGIDNPPDWENKVPTKDAIKILNKKGCLQFMNKNVYNKCINSGIFIAKYPCYNGKNQEL